MDKAQTNRYPQEKTNGFGEEMLSISLFLRYYHRVKYGSRTSLDNHYSHTRFIEGGKINK